MTTFEVRRLKPYAKLPTRATPLSAGYDLYASEDIEIVGGQGTKIIPTDIAIAITDPTIYARVAMRSGLAVNSSLAVSAGVIDPDYRGPIGVVAFCCAEGVHVNVRRGDRIAQLVFERFYTPSLCEVPEFSNPNINDHAGFGSTGK